MAVKAAEVPAVPLVLVPELVPDPVGVPAVPMFGQWCADVVAPLLEEPEDPELEDPELEDPELADPLLVVDPLDEDDVVLDVLATVDARLLDGAPPVLAPATSILAPRPRPRLPATTPAATIG